MESRQSNLQQKLVQPSAGTVFVAQGEQLPLRSWLELSWFFPPEFEREKFVETDRHYLVFGNSRVYKFKKPSLSSEQHLDQFSDRFSLAVRKINENQLLAGDLYLGLQLFYWDEGELLWGKFIAKEDLSSDICSDPGDEVAIVLRRLPDEHLLSNAIDQGAALDNELRRVARTLGSFYRAQLRSPSEDVLLDVPLDSSKGSDPSSLDILTLIVGETGEAQSSMLQLLVLELRSYMRRFQEENEALLSRREERGFFIDLHGALEPAHIALRQPNGSSLRPCIFGRATPSYERSKRDLLIDVAGLTLELHLTGSRLVADSFERSFAEIHPDLYHAEAFVYALAQAALEKALSVLCLGHAGSRKQAEDYLVVAYRYALGYRDPFMIVVTSDSCALAKEMAWKLSRLLQADFLGVAGDQSNLIDAGEGVGVETFLRLASNRFNERTGVVIERTHLSREDRLKLLYLAEDHAVPVCFVRCETSFEVEVLKGGEDHYSVTKEGVVHQRSMFWEEQVLGREIPQVLIEPSYDSLYLARFLAHCFRRVVQEGALLNSSTKNCRFA